MRQAPFVAAILLRLFSSRLWGVFGIAVAAIVTSSTAESALITLSGSLDAAQVVDGGGSTSTATGFATVVFDDVLQTITTSLSWIGLSGVADRSHLHDAPPGHSRFEPPNNRFFHEVITGSGVPCFPGDTTNECVPATGSLVNVFTNPPVGDPTCSFYDNCDFADIVQIALTDGFYIDLHTQMYPSGEIRGQLLVAASVIPEPAPLMLFSIGVLGLTLSRSRRRL